VQRADHDPPAVVRVRAPNPGPFTLTGTNTYVVAGRWVVDPGPADEGHVAAVLAAADGAVEGIVLTHSHADHSDAAGPLADRAGGVPVVLPRDGERIGPFEALATPGHAPDHVCLAFERLCFTGDTVLGEGSVFIVPGERSLTEYLASLRRLRERGFEALCPGHGPYVHDPAAKLDEYVAHRLDRERRLLDALAGGLRDTDDLLDTVWDDAPAGLRGAAAVTLAAHLEKLREERRLPSDMA